MKGMGMKKSFLLITITILSLCVISTFAVEMAKFRACKDSGFCKRQRKYTTATSPYNVLPDTVQHAGSKISAEIQNTQNDVLFTLDIIAYADRIVRMKINEKTPLKPRYEVRDVLLHTIKEVNFDSVTKNEGGLVAKFGDGRSQLKVNYAPFKAELYTDNLLALTANENGLFNFEHLRAKAAAPPAPVEVTAEGGEGENAGEQAAQEAPAAVEPQGETLEDAWEEHFSSHHDSKPNGPSSVGMDFSFIGSRHVYGIPEHASNLALKNTKGDDVDSDPYRLYNLDVFEYELDKTMALYGAVPLMLSHDEGKTVGLFWLNPSETFIDISDGSDPAGRPKKNTHWFSESGIVDVFFLMGPTPKDVFSQYASLTGTGAMPQQFAIGYHQCRWNYKDEEDVRTVDAGFDEHNIPYDVLWLDIEHTDGKRYFTWDNGAFPNPTQMQDGLKAKGRKMVVIIDPHIKRDTGYRIHKEAQSRNMYIKDKSNNEYDGWCWPGSSSYLDFTNPEVRQFWAEKLALTDYTGSTPILYVWNDMNEPSVFNGPETSMHKDAIHWGGWEHRDVHNVYGYYMHMATAEGLIARHPEHNDRPFVLSRAFFAGTQRYGAIWTGDNAAQWGHLEASVPMLLSLGLAGINFAGADVGGFFGNPDTELLTRWYQAGAFTPFFRGHAHIDTKRREPWLFGETYTSLIRESIRVRYTLLPYWYTLFHLNNQTGEPLLRPLWVEFPREEETFPIQDSFMVGGELLVRPVVQPGETSVNVYLPGKDTKWYDYDTLKAVDGYQTITVQTPIEKVPVFIRGGSLIPKRERPRRSSSQMVADPYTLLVALDKKGSASGQLYVDDGHSFDFIKGQYDSITFTYENNKLHSKPQHVGCTSCPQTTVERVVVVGVGKPKSVTLDGKTLEFEYDDAIQKLTIRKPDVKTTTEWTITIQ